jgi:hypothetical protein
VKKKQQEQEQEQEQEQHRERVRSWKPWIARIAFGASILALLGTSQPRWHIDATISGPNDGGAPSADKPTALLVNVEASRGPSLSYTNRLGARVDPFWGRVGSSSGSKDEPIKTSFLLPPYSSLHSLTISGHCNGGCCSNEKCTPTPGSYIRATIDHVSVWTKSFRLNQRVTVHSGPKKDGEKALRVPHVVVEVEASIHVEVVISAPSISTTPIQGSDWKGTPTQLSNCFDPSNVARVAPKTDAAAAAAAVADAALVDVTMDAGATPSRQKCSHYPFNKPVKDPIEVALTVEATTWGACADPTAPCAPPPDEPEPRIVDVRSTTDY